MDKDFRQAVAHKIGRRLTQARAAMHVTLPELAKQSGLRVEHLKLYEAGKRSISVDDLERLAAALRLPVSHFLEACALCGQE